VEVTGAGTETVELGPAPARANSIDIQLVCLSAGGFTVTGGTIVVCSFSDVNDPRGPSIAYPYAAVPLVKGQHSLTVTAATGARWRLTARYASVRTTPWGVNANGQTYGTANDNGTPDLLAVVASNGKTGYAYSSQVGANSCPQPANPSQALEWQNTPLVTVHVPVYLSDGKTPIGQLDEQVHKAYVQAAASQCPPQHATERTGIALVPNVAGMDIDMAAKALTLAGFKPLDGGAIASSSSPGTVVRSTPGGGAKAPTGSDVIIYTSTG
jgi:PASTA domain